MNKVIIALLIVIIICIVGMLAWFNFDSKNMYAPKQEMLARTLVVSIDSYPYPSAFPAGYYRTVLKPGMSVSEVHEFLIGYEKVVNCGVSGFWHTEVYYFFSTEDDKALRFEVIYDENGRFVELRGEDTDSRTIRTQDCDPGLIPE